MTKTVTIDGAEVRLKTSAAIPYMYRAIYGRDVLVEMRAIANGQNEMDALDIWTKLAHLMARHADPENVPETIEVWLEGFSTFGVYELIPTIREMWAENMHGINIPKKKATRRKGS